MTDERREVTLEKLSKLQRAGNVDISDIQVEGICTVFDKDGNVKGQMKVCSVEEAETKYAENKERNE